jgi:dienelactone hydrolase
VQQQDWHTGKIGMIGFSRGGSVALALANQNLLLKGNVVKAGESSKISAIVAYYPGCFKGSHTAKPNAPTLLLLGAKDEWTPISRCNLEAKTDPNYHITIYPNAGHAFDLNRPTRTVYGHYLSYDQEADVASRKATREFFDEFLR